MKLMHALRWRQRQDYVDNNKDDGIHNNQALKQLCKYTNLPQHTFCGCMVKIDI